MPEIQDRINRTITLSTMVGNAHLGLTALQSGLDPSPAQAAGLIQLAQLLGWVVVESILPPESWETLTEDQEHQLELLPADQRILTDAEQGMVRTLYEFFPGEGWKCHLPVAELPLSLPLIRVLLHQAGMYGRWVGTKSQLHTVSRMVELLTEYLGQLVNRLHLEADQHYRADHTATQP